MSPAPDLKMGHGSLCVLNPNVYHAMQYTEASPKVGEDLVKSFGCADVFRSQLHRRASRDVGRVLLAGCGIRPEPLTEPQVAAYALDKKARFVANEEPITQAIGLDEAIARGLRYNLDYRVEAYQTALRIQDLDVADFHLLPNVVANSTSSAVATISPPTRSR